LAELAVKVEAKAQLVVDTEEEVVEAHTTLAQKRARMAAMVLSSSRFHLPTTPHFLLV